MTVSSAVIAVPADGSAVAVTPALNDPASFEVFNTGVRTVWWGGPAVTSGTGVPIAVNTGRTFDLQPSDMLFVCTDASGVGAVRAGEVNG